MNAPLHSHGNILTYYN